MWTQFFSLQTVGAISRESTRCVKYMDCGCWMKYSRMEQYHKIICSSASALMGIHERGIMAYWKNRFQMLGQRLSLRR